MTTTDNLNDLLSSISPEDLERIKGVASSLMAGPSASQQTEQTQTVPSAPTAGLGSMFSDDMANILVRLASEMNRDSDKTAFIRALRPLLSDERQKKADEAMHFLKLMDTLPLLRGML